MKTVIYIGALIIGLLIGNIAIQVKEYYDKKEIVKLEIEKLQLEIQIKEKQLYGNP